MGSVTLGPRGETWCLGVARGAGWRSGSKPPIQCANTEVLNHENKTLQCVLSSYLDKYTPLMTWRTTFEFRMMSPGSAVLATLAERPVFAAQPALACACAQGRRHGGDLRGLGWPPPGGLHPGAPTFWRVALLERSVPVCPPFERVRLSVRPFWRGKSWSNPFWRGRLGCICAVPAGSSPACLGLVPVSDP